MASLIDAAQQLLSLPTPTDSSGAHKTYGTIVNPHVRRRERRGAGAKPVAANAQKPAAKTSTKPLSIVKEEPKVIQLPPAKETAKETASAAAAPAPVKKPVPTLKRGGSSGTGIMQSFAKAAAAKAKKAETSQPATPSGDDSSMQPMSEGEEDDSEVLPQPKVQDKTGRKGKKEREEELRRMMERTTKRRRRRKPRTRHLLQLKRSWRSHQFQSPYRRNQPRLYRGLVVDAGGEREGS